MMKRFSILLLALCLLVLPAAAMALQVSIGDVVLPDGKYMASGRKMVADSKPSGGYAYLKNGVLTLKDYAISDTSFAAIKFSGGDLAIWLEGENSLTNESKTGDGIANLDGKTLTIDGSGSLSVRAGYGVYDYAGAFSTEVEKGSMVIRGGAVTIDANLSGITAGALTISGGTTKIRAQEYGCIYADEAISISGKDTIVDLENRSDHNAYYGAIVSFNSMNIADPLKIRVPEGGYVQINEDMYSGNTYVVVKQPDNFFAHKVYIAADPAGDEPDEDKPDEDDPDGEKAAQALPQTGDDSALMLWVMLACAAAAGALLLRRRAVN